MLHANRFFGFGFGLHTAYAPPLIKSYTKPCSDNEHNLSSSIIVNGFLMLVLLEVVVVVGPTAYSRTGHVCSSSWLVLLFFSRIRQERGNMNFVKENRGTVIDLNGLIPGRELLGAVLIKMGFFIPCFQRKK
jgi:hypothetical protein